MYQENFKNWQDVQSEFRTETPEPDEVILAYYETPGYEGSAFVAYRNGDKYYIVEGSHCSCNGLEYSWYPEEYDSLDALKKVFERRDPYFLSDEIKKRILGL